MQKHDIFIFLSKSQIVYDDILCLETVIKDFQLILFLSSNF